MWRRWHSYRVAIQCSKRERDYRERVFWFVERLLEFWCQLFYNSEFQIVFLPLHFFCLYIYIYIFFFLLTIAFSESVLGLKNDHYKKIIYYFLKLLVEREKRRHTSQQQQEHADEAMRSPSQTRAGAVSGGTSRRPSGREVLDMRQTPSRHRTITKS